MSGFAIVALLYAGLWALLLAPGALVLARRSPRPALPDDDPDATAWTARARQQLEARAGRGGLRPEEVPTFEAPSRRLPAASEEAVRVDGSLHVPAGMAVDLGLVVEGDLRCGEGAVLLAPVLVRGEVVLESDVRTASIVADGDVTVGPQSHVRGGVSSAGTVRVAEGGHVDGKTDAAEAVELEPGAVVGSALAPVVRCGPLPADVTVADRTSVQPIDRTAWDAELDTVLDELWPQGRLDEIVEEIAERTGAEVRAIQVMRRARHLGILERGIPRRPRWLGRRPAWVLTLEIVRVGADLRVPEQMRIGYSLVVEGALELLEEAELEAPARSGRGVLLHRRSVVHGPVASDGLIVCEEGSAIFGPADSSMHVLLFANARIGVPGAGGVHAKGAIGLEPGAEIIGGAMAGSGVRGEALRPEPLRTEAEGTADEVEEPERGRRKKRRRRRKGRGRRSPGPPPSGEQPQVEVWDVPEEADGSEADGSEADAPPEQPARPARQRPPRAAAKASKRAPSKARKPSPSKARKPNTSKARKPKRPT